MDGNKTTAHFPAVGFFIIALCVLLATLGGCFRQSIRDSAPRGHVDVSHIKNPSPHYLPKSRYGNPASYVANGRRYYVLKSTRYYRKRGIASWYGTKFHGRLTSTRERYNVYGMTAASPELPIPCYVRVTNLQNGREVIVKVNDRGPFAANRIIDLSYVAAKKLGFSGRGTAWVEVSSIDLDRPYRKEPVAQFAYHRPRLYVQVGVFSQFANANHLKQTLTHLTQRTIQITEISRRLRALYRVQIGPLQNVEESDNLLQRIQRAGLGHAITIII